jgi:hypothetical protein
MHIQAKDCVTRDTSSFVGGKFIGERVIARVWEGITFGSRNFVVEHTSSVLAAV